MNTLISKARDYFSLVKFSHTVFALPFAIIGFTLGITSQEHHFSLKILLLILLCMVFARNAAMGFNRYADRIIDAMNPRTAGREIPSGRINKKAAAAFVAVNAALFIITTGFINRLTLILSPVALAVILGYSLTKRITWLCHFILGLGLSLAPIGAYISVTGRFDLVPLIFSFIVITWVSGFDILYALQDDEFDRENKLYSIPSHAGRKGAIIISALVHFLTFVLVISAGLVHPFGTIYWAGAGIFSLLLTYQHLIVKTDDISRVNLAFATTNGIGSILFALFAVCDLVL
ncbi:MAG TPA: UbiA-like polyprenyltransferase [Bacteroidales bacterium]|nr:UbiA-like polyprenyltransferase [Bacteroidales bacterium]